VEDKGSNTPERFSFILGGKYIGAGLVKLMGDVLQPVVTIADLRPSLRTSLSQLVFGRFFLRGKFCAQSRLGLKGNFKLVLENANALLVELAELFFFALEKDDLGFSGTDGGLSGSKGNKTID
jgi:hypothetical protein